MISEAPKIKKQSPVQSHFHFRLVQIVIWEGWGGGGAF